MKLHAITDESQGYLRNDLYWELEESDYGTLPVSEECLAIVRATQDGLFLGRPRRVNKTFNEDSQVPVYYIADSVWPNKQAPKSSFKNGVTGAESEADAPDPEYRIWYENFDSIKSWRVRLSKTVTSMCRMYWDPNFPHMNRNACYELRNGGLALVGGAAEECKENETEQGGKPYRPSAPVDTSNPSEWAWKYSEVPFPETMQQVEKMATPLKQRGANKYGWDFGKYTFSAPNGVPSLERSIAVIKRYHLFAIARALVLRSRDIRFPWQYVYNSTKESTVNNSRISPYRDVMIWMSEEGTTAEEEMILASCDEIVGYYKKYLEGNVRNESKKFADITGKPWDIKHFVIELRENLHIELKKLGKPVKKEGR